MGKRIKPRSFLKSRYNRSDERVSPIRLKRWTRETLAAFFRRCGYRLGAEIGVREGEFSEVLCKSIPELCLYCIDPWDHWPGHKDMNRHADDPSKFLEEAKERLSAYDCHFMRMKSIEAVNNVADNSLDFVYIDGDHTFNGTMLDLIMWSPKVRKGGMIAGHDFKFYRLNGVISAVMCYTKNHRIHDYYITGEREASYFWVKE